MEFFVYSRGAVERMAPHDVPHVIISITTTADDAARLAPAAMCRGVLRLSFPDADLAAGYPDVFDADDANAICDFVQLHREQIARIVVHCDAGVSRSPGVAAALAVCLGQDDAEFFRRYRPNMHVYRTLLNTWHARIADADPVG